MEFHLQANTGCHTTGSHRLDRDVLSWLEENCYHNKIVGPVDRTELILGPFAEATELTEGEKIITISMVVPTVLDLNTHLIQMDSPKSLCRPLIRLIKRLREEIRKSLTGLCVLLWGVVLATTIIMNYYYYNKNNIINFIYIALYKKKCFTDIKTTQMQYRKRNKKDKIKWIQFRKINAWIKAFYSWY